MRSRRLTSNPKRLLAIVMRTFFLILLACSGGRETASDSSSDTGLISFSLVFEGAIQHQHSRAAALDCAGIGVSIIEASVYDQENTILAGGGPWDCNAGQGTIDEVLAGSDRSIVLLGKDADGNVVFRGEKTVDVVAGSSNNAGEIHCTPFSPGHSAPENGSAVEADGLIIEWHTVPGALQYRLLLSENEDLTEPIIDELTTNTNYLLEGLSDGLTYFWQIMAIDAYGNTGEGATPWSFTIKAFGPLSFQYGLVSNGEVVDCARAGVSTIEASVYDPDHAFLSDGGPWYCNTGQGTIALVEAGSDRTIVLLGRDLDGNVVVRGEKTIDVVAGSETYAGAIDCTPFISNLSAPANETVVEAGGLVIAWDAVAGSAGYQVLISENQDLSDPVIDEAIATINYTPTALSNGTTYFWQVIPVDAYGNSGSSQTTWSFATRAWASIAAGYCNSYAVKPGGTLWAWGDNSAGQLGLDDWDRRATPTQVGSDTDWASVHSGFGNTVVSNAWTGIRTMNHTLALKTDGSLWAWGANYYGQLGLDDRTTRSTPTRVGDDTDWETVYAGADFSVALKSDGTLWAWGMVTGSSDTPGQVGDDTDWVAVSAGDSHMMALKSNGSLWAWGYNYYGQLGLGDTEGQAFPTRVGEDTDWIAVSAGDRHTLAVKTDGSLWAWGANYDGQLGLGDRYSRYTPTRVGEDTDWVAVHAGRDHTVAFKTDGGLWAWGGNSRTQLGLGDKEDRLTPTRVGDDTDWEAVHVGRHHTVALKTDGTLWVCGWSSHGQLGNGTTGHKLRPLRIGSDTDWAEVHAGSNHAVALKTDGSLWTWGYNYYGQLGLGDTNDRTSLTQVDSDTDWGRVYAGGSHTMALKADGSLWAWGDNDDGLLGIGHTSDQFIPTQVGSGTDWEIISTYTHTVSLKTDGSLWTWGFNYSGQLGFGDTDERLTPTRVGADTDWEVVHARGSYTVALKTGGSLWVWGDNDYGQLGLGDTEDRLSPTRVGGDSDWTAVQGGNSFGVALKTDSSLWAWGDNDYGQLGSDDTASRSTPAQVGDDTDWADVHAGRNHTVAVKTDGSLWAWGDNDYGQLGLGDTDDRSSPTRVGSDTDWIAVYGGGRFTVGLKTYGSLWAWGDNYYGYLGDDGDAWEDSFIQISLGGDSPTCADPTADFTGEWLIAETSTDNDCGEGTGAPYTVEIRQTGSSVTAFHPASGRTFTGVICAATVELTGRYPEDGGTTTLNPMTATVSADRLTGTSNWTWSDESESCSGTTTFIGTKE